MVDARLIKKTTLSENVRRINVADLKNAYEKIEIGRSRDKLDLAWILYKWPRGLDLDVS
jgi:hypothetical protein